MVRGKSGAMTPNVQRRVQRRRDAQVEIWLVMYQANDFVPMVVRSRRFGLDPRYIPEWLDIEIANNGWEVFLSDDSYFDPPEGCVTWMAQHGIAPGQPFKVRVQPPDVWQDHEGDWDAEYELAEVCEVRQWSAIRVLAAWANLAEDWCLYGSAEWRQLVEAASSST